MRIRNSNYCKIQNTMTSTSIESVDGIDTTLVENQSTVLLDLPHVTINNILRNLDLHTLKKLRLVSKSTKEWVEQTEILQKFKIHISSVERQDELTNSTKVPWNNFVITLRRDGPLKEINSKFAEKFGPFIKHFVVNNDSGVRINLSNNIISSLITNPTIETLCIKKLKVEKDWIFESAQILINNFKNIKKLKIEELCHKQISEAKTLFEMILQSCTSLTHLHLPMLTTVGNDGNAALENLHYEVLLTPLSNYLNRIHKSVRRNNLIIDFDGFEDEEQNRKIIPISSDGLLELSKMCAKTGTKLHNVTSRAFTNYNRSMTVFKDVVSSIKMLNDPSGLRGIYLPPNIEVNVEIRADDVDYSFFELQETIHSINFSSKYLTIPDNLYLNVFQVVRPSVQELKCDWYMGEMWGHGDLQAIWTAIDIFRSFANLKNLQLENFGFYREGPDLNILLSGLQFLERLCLKNCYMKEEGLMGPDPNNPLILQLQNLHITKAVRHMRLKTFVLKCGRPRSAHLCPAVTFKTGISTLCSIDGGFGDTIEHFEVSISHDSTKEEMDVYVNQFKNLKTYKTFDRCSQQLMSVDAKGYAMIAL